MDDGDDLGIVLSHNTSSGSKSSGDKMFSLKKWNAVAMWSWDVECDTCAICRVQTLVSGVRQKTNKRTVLLCGESVTIPSITAACPFGSSRTIAAPSASRTGWFRESANNPPPPLAT
ncbi:RING-box protein 2 isoform X2 [Nerophis ophidion]|uniref:RING-box protein 2 isoform X2 n=1 Tax=Nerophis ophidion TaxID=159077 RepID=UPI002ADF443F|nr:RING-box protein 2 isoform X2 [Nerophis ophidion]